MSRPIILVLSSFLIAGSGTAQAEIYKSVTKSGETIYTDRLTRDATNVEVVKSKIGRSSAPRPTPEQLTKASDATKAEAEKIAKIEAERAEDVAIRKRNCEQAKSRSASLELPRINRVNDDGSRTRMPEEWRQTELAAAKAAVKTYCD